MAKWADYCVSAVKYDDEGNHIEYLKVHQDLGDKLSVGESWAREDVVSSIDEGNDFITVTKNTIDGKWQEGEEIHVVEVNGIPYLRTDANEKASDNLGSLPEF